MGAGGMTVTRICGLGALALFAALSRAAAQPMTQAERTGLVLKLDASEKQFFAAIEGLSEAEWHWKPASDKWSVAEVSDHLDLAEIKTLELVRDMASRPSTPEKKAEVSGKDERVEKEIPDRSQHRMMRPDFLAPIDRWPSPAALMKDYKANRAKTIAWVRATQDDLRSRMAPHPEMGLMDGYQWLLLIAAHCERHTAQILEIKALPGFPKR